MAYQPQRIQDDIILELLNDINSYHCWNLKELVHASCILFNFHKLSSFVNSLDISIPFNILFDETFSSKFYNLKGFM